MSRRLLQHAAIGLNRMLIYGSVMTPKCDTFTACTAHVAGRSTLCKHATAQLTSWQWSVLEDLGPGDVFIFVGVASLDPFKRRPKALTDKGVLTGFYSTEADFAHKCSLKQSIHVREVWEYNQSNVLCCQSFSRRPWRYGRPGYIQGYRWLRPLQQQST